jgi:hypothetical protein
MPTTPNPTTALSLTFDLEDFKVYTHPYCCPSSSL